MPLQSPNLTVLGPQSSQQSAVITNQGTRHVIRTFAKFGLEVHTGYTGPDGKVVVSKTEFTHVPCFGQESTDADTAPFEISEGRFVTYTPLFRYLGTLVEYTLLDNTDIDSRIQQAQGAQTQTSWPLSIAHCQCCPMGR